MTTTIQIKQSKLHEATFEYQDYSTSRVYRASIHQLGTGKLMWSFYNKDKATVVYFSRLEWARTIRGEAILFPA
jgi:hypothetical protein